MAGAVEEVDRFHLGAVDDADAAVLLDAQVAQRRQTHQQVLGFAGKTRHAFESKGKGDGDAATDSLLVWTRSRAWAVLRTAVVEKARLILTASMSTVVKCAVRNESPRKCAPCSASFKLIQSDV